MVNHFIYAGKANVPEYMVKGGETYRLITDQLGSVRLVVNSQTGEVKQEIDYDAWGNVLSDTNPVDWPYARSIIVFVGPWRSNVTWAIIV